MAIDSYRDLDVWKVAMDLVESIYRLTRKLPKEEKIGLVSQMRHAAVSVSLNIAEGSGRSHRREFLHHLSFARGSVKEVEAALLISVRLGLLTRERASEAWGLSQRVGQMLTRLIQSLERG